MSSKVKPPTRVVGRRKTAAPKKPLATDASETLGFALAEEFMDLATLPETEPELGRRDPAEVAAVIQLEWAMVVQAVTAGELRSPSTVCEVVIPTGEWAEPVYEAWTYLVSGPSNTKRVEHFSGFSRKRQMTLAYLRAKTPDKFEREREADAVAEAIWQGYGIVGFAPEPDWLPPDLVAAADHRLRINPLHSTAASELARRLTGTEPTITLTADEAAAAGPRLFRLACRPEQTANAYLAKLRELVQEAVASPPTERPAADPIRDDITLDRLAGMDEAVAWGLALKDDLDAYRHKRRSWLDVDRGVLVSGPTGCGKTTYAKALARTCGVPLIQGSWSRWLANGGGHQGDFMIAMKKTFAEARETAPCILFLDEIDSFPDRATLTHSHKDWDIQCVNAVLAELDGVQGREGVVVVAACNHPHLLDAALTRSGRLDRHVRIGLPNTDALERILQVHLRGELAGTELHHAALLALGSSGADVERLVRNAKRRARNANRPMEIADLLAEIGGSDDRTPAELRLAAIHEAGHAIAAVELGMPLTSVSIQQTDKDGGNIQARFGGSYPRASDINSRLVFLLAGRAAEEILLVSPSAGSGGGVNSDLARASWLAAKARFDLGLGEGADLLWRGISDNHAELREAFTGNPSLAEQVKRDLADAYRTALELVLKSRVAVEAIADELVERRVLQDDDVQNVVAAVRRPLSCE